MNYREKKIKEFREKFTYSDKYLADDMRYLKEERPEAIEAFLSETIEECHSFNESKVRGVTGYCVGWNAHHDAVENKFEGKEAV